MLLRQLGCKYNICKNQRLSASLWRNRSKPSVSAIQLYPSCIRGAGDETIFNYLGSPSIWVQPSRSPVVFQGRSRLRYGSLQRANGGVGGLQYRQHCDVSHRSRGHLVCSKRMWRRRSKNSKCADEVRSKPQRWIERERRELRTPAQQAPARQGQNVESFTHDFF
jgi:hypothetical protein